MWHHMIGPFKYYCRISSLTHDSPPHLHTSLLSLFHTTKTPLLIHNPQPPLAHEPKATPPQNHYCNTTPLTHHLKIDPVFCRPNLQYLE